MIRAHHYSGAASSPDLSACDGCGCSATPPRWARAPLAGAAAAGTPRAPHKKPPRCNCLSPCSSAIRQRRQPVAVEHTNTLLMKPCLLTSQPLMVASAQAMSPRQASVPAALAARGPRNRLLPTPPLAASERRAVSRVGGRGPGRFRRWQPAGTANC